MVSSAEIRQITCALGTIITLGTFLMCYHGNIWVVAKLKKDKEKRYEEKMLAMSFRKSAETRFSTEIDPYFLPSYVGAVYAMMILSYLSIVLATAATLFSVFVKKIKYVVLLVLWTQYCLLTLVALSIFAGNYKDMFPDFSERVDNGIKDKYNYSLGWSYFMGWISIWFAGLTSILVILSRSDLCLKGMDMIYHKFENE